MEDRLGRSVAKKVFFQGGFKLQRPVYHGNDGLPCYYVLNPGAGYVDGDTYSIKVRLLDKAKLTLTTLGATKIYKTPVNPVYQEMELHLGKEAFLEYLPDPLVAYQNARYTQKSSIFMEKGSTLFYADILTPGWAPDKSKFSYDNLRLKTEIFMEGELSVFDHIHLQPEKQNIRGLGFMENFSHLGTFIVIGEKTDNSLITYLHDELQQIEGNSKFGISKLTVPGFTLRIMANMTQDIEKVMHACHRLVYQKWYGTKPHFLRKY